MNGGKKFDVQVRLSTVGAGELSSSAATVATALRNVHNDMNATEMTGRRLSTTFRGTDEAGQKFSFTMRQLAESHRSYVRVADQLSGTVTKLGTALAGMWASLQVGSAVKGFFDQGVALNALLETSQLGIAATILSYRQYRDEQGRVVVGQQASNLAMREGANVQRLLQAEAFNTVVTLEAMLKGYQALQMGAASQKTTSEQLAAFTSTLGNVATATGRSFEELSAQTSRVLMGVLDIRNPIVALMRGMGVDNATIRSWVNQGTAIKEIQERLGEFLRIGPEINKTWAGVKSNVEDLVQQLAGFAAAPVMESIKSLGESFVGALTTTVTEGGRQVTRISDSVKSDARLIGETLRFAFEGAEGAAKSFTGVFFESKDKSLRDYFIEAAEGAAKFKGQLEEIGRVLSIPARAQFIPIQTLRGLVSLVTGDFAGAGEKATWLGKWGTDLATALSGDDEKSASGRIQALRKLRSDMQRIRAAQYNLAANVLDTDAGSPGNGDPRDRGPDAAALAQITAATDALGRLYDKADQRHDLAGLTGLALQLAQIEKQADAANEAMVDAYNKAIDAGWKPTKADSVLFDTKRARAEADVLVAQVTKIEEAREKAAERAAKTEIDYYRAMVDFAARASSDVIEINLAAAEKEIEQVRRTEAEKWAAYMRTHILDADLTEKELELKGAAAKKIEQIQADANAKNKEILDVQLGDWNAYYDDLTKHSADAHENIFIAAQENARKVADAMVAAAQTGAEGLAAGFAKIKSSVTSFGQDVASTVQSLAGSLTSTLETGIFDVLTGKFDDFRDALKSLWNSILKDFSQLLAKMVERWILTGDAMGNGQGGGVFGGLFSGGSNAVYTPGGTANQGEGWAPVYGAGASLGSYQTSGNASWLSGGGAAGGGAGGLGTAASLGAYGAYAYGLYSGISSVFKPHETSMPTYQGQSLGQTADFGGPGGGAAFSAAAVVALTAATATLATVAATGVAITAAATATVPVVGWIAAAVLLIIAALMTIFAGPEEGHISVAIKDAFDKTGARSAAGHFVGQIIDQTSNFVGQLALKAAGPEGVQKFVTSYNKYFREALGSATFDLAAGDKEDLQKDVENFFNSILPKLALQAAFGQVGFGMPLGDRDWAGGAAGLDWNTNNALMDAQGNFVKKQLFDPNAPIPLMLSGLGFTAEAIGGIATKLSASTDMKVFKQWLIDLVGVVVDLGALAKAFGQTTQQWFDSIRALQGQQGTAAQFTADIANLTATGSMLETVFGDDRVTAAQQLVKESQTLLNNMGQALASILQLIDTITSTTATTTESYRNKLLTPAELEAGARASYTRDITAIATAANPKEVQAAWQQVMKDLSTVLDAIVARIQTIKSLQQGYADFRLQMAEAAGPQFATDPAGWLAKNQAAIDAIDWGEPIKGAQTLLDLEKTRYSNLAGMLQRVDSVIQGITNSFATSVTNLRLQGMGSVTTDAQGNATWTPDIHAQGDFLNAQIQSLMGQLGTATTPEQVNAITNQIQGLISQLASQPQEPGHYAESREILIKLSKDAEAASLAALGKMHDAITGQLKGIGDQLKLGETALATALGAAQQDFTAQIGLMSAAGTKATAALVLFGDQLTSTMQDLTSAINHWIWVMTHPDGTADPNWKDPNAPKHTPVSGYTPPETSGPNWETDPDDPTYEINIRTGARRKKPTRPTVTPRPGLPSAPPPPINVTVNVTSGAPEDVARAAVAAAAPVLHAAVIANVRQSNAELVRVLRNNPNLLVR